MVLARDETDTATTAERLVALGLQHARGSRPERPFLLETLNLADLTIRSVFRYLCDELADEEPVVVNGIWIAPDLV